ncbi:MAG: hypothetical protein BGO82_20280 [Devosia sp. 67-54]|uniref:hypothetical protein n=1 Tax=unclassified Devosia TaxID=196773 RepID=UPI000959DC79|nr:MULTISPECIES: hypothetical protein [unclassified Devosia]MBN9306432.1 hypothetical protein [Devosia sp.]OJX18485.1 MAG: hypothetical protein BGO82_20280 [Devosia sp. 67-54]
MKIRSLLLGSAALAGLSTAGYAADLGVVTSLDVCDELGLSGLTISSDDNCLVITGNVAFEYDWGDYTPGRVYGDFASVSNDNNYNVLNPASPLDSNQGDVDTWLKFVATADSDFGPAQAVIKLISENGTGDKAGNTGKNGFPSNADQTVGIDEAWVGIGDTTMIMAGYKSSIFNKGDDAPLNYLGLFNSNAVNTGVSWHTSGATTGGDVIQIVSNLGNGVSVGGGLEGLAGTFGNLTAVGVMSYAGDGISAHFSGAVGNGGWKIHTGFTGAWDPIKVVAAVATDNTGYYNALGSVAATFDMFTLAASGETASDGYGVGGSATAKVTDGVTINLGGNYWHHTTYTGPGASTNDGAAAYDLWRVEAGLSAAVTESITLTAAAGYESTTAPAVGTLGGPSSDFYGKAGVAWAPGGGFTSSTALTVNSLGGYKAVFKAAKSIK